MLSTDTAVSPLPPLSSILMQPDILRPASIANLRFVFGKYDRVGHGFYVIHTEPPCLLHVFLVIYEIYQTAIHSDKGEGRERHMIFDIVIAVIIALAVIKGFRRGLFYMTLRILIWAGAVVAGIFLTGRVAEFLTDGPGRGKGVCGYSR